MMGQWCEYVIVLSALVVWVSGEGGVLGVMRIIEVELFFHTASFLYTPTQSPPNRIVLEQKRQTKN